MRPEVVSDPADALDRDLPRRQVRQVEEVGAFIMLDRMLTDWRRQAGGLQQEADTTSELGSRRRCSVLGEEYISIPL